MKTTSFVLISVALLSASPLMAQSNKRDGKVAPPPTYYSWMSPDVSAAWQQGYQGQGVTITVVDDFRSRDRFSGNLTGVTSTRRHGDWTLQQARLIAPKATLKSDDFSSGRQVSLSRGFNVLNLSYGVMAPSGLYALRMSRQESSIIGYARNGQAVVSKAAGNDYGTAIGQPSSEGEVDYLNRDLIGAPSAIFVGALSTNGSPQTPAVMADYSNIAGHNPTVQNQFLVVGVEGHRTDLYGTSFAAPVISGYAAILSSKFTRAQPTQIVNQLLSTARQDTLVNYTPAVHGQGEASLSRALAPASIR